MNQVLPQIAQLNLLAIGLALVGIGAMLAFNSASRKLMGAFLTTLLLFIMLPVDDLALTFVTRVVHVRYDQYVFCIDQFFGSPSYAMGQLFLRWPWFQNVALYVYVLVPSICLGLAIVRYALLPLEEGVRTVRTVVISCLLAYPLYALFPVAGPRYAFPSFPFNAPGHLTPHPVYIPAVPNGVPSVHMTLAIVVFWFSKRWLAGRVLGTLFIVLTIAATLGSGEHYLVDLLFAVPYASLVLYLGGNSSARTKERIDPTRREVEA